MIQVVAAVIEVDGRFLVTRRREGTHLAGLWEFPGGKVDPGEAHEQALVRELGEELGVGATIGPLLFEVTHDYTERSVSLYFYACRLVAEPRPMLGQEMRWVLREDLDTLDFPAADEALLSRLKSNSLA